MELHRHSHGNATTPAPLPLFSHVSAQTGRILLGALALFLGHPNPVLHVPGLVLLAPLCLYSMGTKQRGLAAIFVPAWLMGGLGYALCLYWLYLPMTNVGQVPLFLVIPCITMLGLYLGLFTGVAALCIRIFFRQFRTSAWGRLFLVPMLSALAFGGLEILVAWLFTGFPWLTLSTSFALWPVLIQGASVVGVYGLSALYALMVFFCAATGIEVFFSKNASLSGLAPPAPHEAPSKHATFFPACTALLSGLVLFSALVLFGAARLGVKESLRAIAEPDTLYTFGMVQGNVDQNQKWDPTFQHHTVQKYLDLSESLLRMGQETARPLDMILWPETAMPIYYGHAEPYDTMLRQFAKKHETPLGFGTLGFDRMPDGTIFLYNRFQLIDHKGQDSAHYDKQHLVPFGEYIPFITVFSFLQKILQGMSFTPGSADAPLFLLPASALHAEQGGQPGVQTANSIPLGILICYEAIFPEIAQKRVADGATVLVNITNDAWFGMTSAPYQHLSLAAMRAVEQMRPLLRCTNTGITAIIDAYGQVTQTGPLFVDDTTIVTIEPKRTLTFYHEYADVIDSALLLGLILALCLLVRDSFRKTSGKQCSTLFKPLLPKKTHAPTP